MSSSNVPLNDSLFLDFCGQNLSEVHHNTFWDKRVNIHERYRQSLWDLGNLQVDQTFKLGEFELTTF